MRRDHAAILDDKSNRGLRRVTKNVYFFWVGGRNLKFVVGEENGGLEGSKQIFQVSI